MIVHPSFIHLYFSQNEKLRWAFHGFIPFLTSSVRFILCATWLSVPKFHGNSNSCQNISLKTKTVSLIVALQEGSGSTEAMRAHILVITSVSLGSVVDGVNTGHTLLPPYRPDLLPEGFYSVRTIPHCSLLSSSHITVIICTATRGIW